MSLTIDPIAFFVPIPFIGWWPIYWYGISWVLAILTIHWVAKKTITSTANFSTQGFEDFLFGSVSIKSSHFLEKVRCLKKIKHFH